MPSARKKFRMPKQQPAAQVNERDEDRKEWMRMALAIWDSQFADDEPKYSSNMIKKSNPAQTIQILVENPQRLSLPPSHNAGAP
ncbi:hypothetical protein HUU05_29620 [candidate division KSB1 bacterium]|nr:hypothetical protein [candidate division KSB1 bacterium]